MRKEIARTLPEPIKRMLRGLVIVPLRSYIRYFPSATGKTALWKSVLAHMWWLESYARAKTKFGSILFVDARDICGRFIYYFGTWEPNLTAWIRKTLQPGDTFVDIGANLGYFSLLASGLVGPTGKVVAIEPAPQTFGVLTANLKANDARNVRPVNLAVWDREEKLPIFVAPDAITGTSTLVAAWAEQWDLVGRCEVSSAPLSAILDQKEIKTARLIKIDVEGAEWRVISGIASVLEAGRRDLEVMVEVATKLEIEGHTYRDVLSFFQNHGFYPYRIVNDYLASSYIGSDSVGRPQRIQQIPTDVDQVDLIFSRKDADAL